MNEWQPKSRDLRASQRDIDSGIYTGGRDNEKLFIERTARILGVRSREVPALFGAPEEKAFRINPYGFSHLSDHADQLSQVQEDLSDFAPSPISWYKNAFSFDAQDTALIQASSSGESGKIFIQTPSSYLPVHALLARSGQDEGLLRVLDLCAAPGGKTALIASETRDLPEVEIIANDAKGRRVQRMTHVLRTLHIPEQVVTISQKDGVQLLHDSRTKFDRILVDAECSTDAGVNFSGRQGLNGWSMGRVEEATRIQKRLVTAAYDGLNDGGTMVYSTCTLSPEENESTIDYLLTKRTDAIIQPMHFEGEQTVASMRRWGKRTYPEAVSRGILRVFPQGYMDSFCLTVVHKPTGISRVDKELAETLNLNDAMKSH